MGPLEGFGSEWTSRNRQSKFVCQKEELSCLLAMLVLVFLKFSPAAPLWKHRLGIEGLFRSQRTVLELVQFAQHLTPIS